METNALFRLETCRMRRSSGFKPLQLLRGSASPACKLLMGQRTLGVCRSLALGVLQCRQGGPLVGMWSFTPWLRGGTGHLRAPFTHRSLCPVLRAPVLGRTDGGQNAYRTASEESQNCGHQLRPPWVHTLGPFPVTALTALLPMQETPSSASTVPWSQKQMTLWLSGSMWHSSPSQWLQFR